jgi:prolyl 4-hydroxylase
VNAALDADVGAHLLRWPEAARLPAEGLEIYTLPYFLSEQECAELIARIDAEREPSWTFDPPAADYRTSETCNLRRADPIVAAVETKLGTLTGIDTSRSETIQGQRYAAGQEFKPHLDAFNIEGPHWPEQKRIGGQRTWTMMIFLNEPGEGGETRFPLAGVRVAPRTGLLLAWNNLRGDGLPNRQSLHQGVMVERGTKYIITKWYRERAYRPRRSLWARAKGRGRRLLSPILGLDARLSTTPLPR